MYLIEYLKEYGDKKIELFVDMDGVIADYIFGSAKDYDKKRPLFDSIKKLEIVSKMPNIKLYIFSCTRKTDGIVEKNWWIDKYASFFKKGNRIIISREANNMEDSAVLKAKYLKEHKRADSIIIVIDDDPRNLKEISKLNDDIILLKDTVLVDDSIQKYDEINSELFITLCNLYKDISWKYKLNSKEFILGVDTPDGIIKKNLQIEYWNDLSIKEIYNLPNYDNCTCDDIKVRIKSLSKIN